ncbi:MAG: phosphate signaling complex protein PhoU [Peptococcaceae bacterium]|nr:phosphate signaling complex protein PhoU [Peptococcaceae bacterium]
MRDVFVGQIERLHHEIIEMGGLCEDVITKSAQALIKGDATIAHEVVTMEPAIDEKEYIIEGLCSSLLLMQQPVASDFREISAASKIIANLSRIAMQAVDISETILRVNYNVRPVKTKHFEELAEAVSKMLKDCIDAYAKMDVELAARVIDFDDVVDEFFYKTKANIAKLIKKADSTEEVDYALDLLMIDKYYERIGDHIVKMAEMVAYVEADKPIKNN